MKITEAQAVKIKAKIVELEADSIFDAVYPEFREALRNEEDEGGPVHLAFSAAMAAAWEELYRTIGALKTAAAEYDKQQAILTALDLIDE